MQKRLTKSNDKVLAGVFGGIANYFNLDPTWVRIIGAVLILFIGCGIPGTILHIIAAIVMPEADPNGRPNTMDGNFTKSDSNQKMIKML